MLQTGDVQVQIETVLVMLGDVFAGLPRFVDVREGRSQHRSRQSKGQPQSCEATRQYVRKCSTLRESISGAEYLAEHSHEMDGGLGGDVEPH